LPPERILGALITSLKGEDIALFMDFITTCLSWVPGERINVYQAIYHPWLKDKNEDQEADDHTPDNTT
jgi:hypothetical protein